MISFQQYYSKFSHLYESLILEGGQAADKLTEDLKKIAGNDKLRYVRANTTPNVLAEVQSMLSVLRKKGFISDREPSYILGSSRLFAIKAGLGRFQPNEIETQSVIDKALTTKKDFGDIDLDVYFNDGIEASDVAFFLNNEFPGKYAAAAAGEEINTAVVVGNTNDVVQIDIVNVKDKEEYFKFAQFSSFADLAAGIKGAMREILIRSIVSTTPISQKKLRSLSDLIRNSDQYKEFEKKNSKKGEVSFRVRYSLGGAGLSYKVEWLVDGKEKSYSSGGVKFDQLQKFIQGDDVSAIPYENLEIAANIIGFKTPEHMKHVVEMAKVVSTFDKERQEKIWNMVVRGIESKIPNPARGRRIGQMSIEDALSALNYLKPHFNKLEIGDINDIIKSEDNESALLGEAAGMISIPHLDQMTPKDFCNLFSGGGWEISEKYDGSNVSFGLDQEGSVYVKSKRGNPVTDPRDYINTARSLDNDIFEGFASLLENLNKSEIKAYLDSLQNKMGVPIQIFGEMFSKAHMNVIEYSPELVGDGAVVIFGVVKATSSKGEDITTTKLGKEIKQKVIDIINNSSGWKAYDKKPIDLKVRDIIKKQIKRVCSIENMANLTSRKRSDQALALKAKAVKEFERLKMLVKRNLLTGIKSEISSLGASEIEGAIIRNMENGAIAKLVDLEDFGKRRVEQWAGIGALKEYRKSLYKELKDNILKNADIFILSDKQVQKINDALEDRGSKFVNMDQIFDVLYSDAANEVEFIESHKMVDELMRTLNEYKIDIEGALLKIDDSDKKAKADTESAVNAEKKRIDSFKKELENRLNSNSNPYLSVIKFVLGPKFLDEMQNKYLKNK